MIVCHCEETVLGIIRYLATSLQTVGQNSFAGEPQLLRVISKGIKCPAHILCKTTSPQTSNSTTLFLSVNHEASFTADSFLQMFFYPTNTTSFSSNEYHSDLFLPFLTTEDQMSAVSDGVLSSIPFQQTISFLCHQSL